MTTTPPSEQTTPALYSDDRWASSTASPLGAAARERDDLTVVDVGCPSPSQSSSRLSHSARPGQLNYSQTSGSEGESSSQCYVGVFSPAFSVPSPQLHRHGYSSATTPPTPAPRAVKVKQLEDEVSQLKYEMKSLQLQNSELQSQLQSKLQIGMAVDEEDTSILHSRVAQLEDQNKKLKEASSMNVDRLTEKISHLELCSMTSDQTIVSLKKELEIKTNDLNRREDEVEREKREKRQLEQSLASLKVEHERVEGERRILERERDRLKEEVKSNPSSGGAISRSNSVSTRDQRVEKRLNDALRDRKQLEDKLVQLEKEVNNLKAYKQAAEQESLARIQLLQEELESVKEENDRMKHEQLVRAEQEKQLLQQQLERQRAESIEIKQNLELREREMSRLREEGELMERQYREKLQEAEERTDRQLQDYQSEMESTVAEKEAGIVRLREQMEKLNSEKDSLCSRIDSLESDLQTVKSDGDRAKNALVAELEVIKNDRDQAHKVRNNVVGELTALKEIKKKNETLQNALKKEAEYIMTDLEEVNAKLSAAQQERDKVTHQKDKVMIELSKRNREIQMKDEQIQKLDQHLKAKDEKITILDIQLQTYHSDFESERKSREKMAARVEQLTEELRAKEADVNRLRSDLNRVAANQMKAEMEMEFLASQEGVDQYATVQPRSQRMLGSQGQMPVRARDPDQTHPPQGAPYHMHTPRQ